MFSQCILVFSSMLICNECKYMHSTQKVLETRGAAVLFVVELRSIECWRARDSKFANQRASGLRRRILLRVLPPLKIVA
jgi:hypothetical protein